VSIIEATTTTTTTTTKLSVHKEKNEKNFWQLREETKVASKLQYAGGREGKMSA
jgi:hypothetical protein